MSNGTRVLPVRGDFEVTATNIDSQATPGGQILTADGSGGAAWAPAGSDVDPATTTTLGTVKMSTAPVSAGSPIAVGDNDSRNTNARTPTAHHVSHQAGGSDIVSVTATMVSSGVATNGEVLTADGATGASWQPIGGTLSGMTPGQVQIASGASAIGGNTRFTFANASGATPVYGGGITGGGFVIASPFDIEIHGTTAYVTSNDVHHAVAVVDLTTPTSPTLVVALLNGDAGGAYINANTIGVASSGNFLYIVNSDGTPGVSALEIMNISTPTSPVHIATFMDGTSGSSFVNAFDVQISGTHAFITSPGALTVLDISTPATPTYVTRLAHGTGGAVLNGAGYFKIIGSYAYIVLTNASSTFGIEVVDISTPSAPVHVTFLSLLYAFSIDGAGSHLYVTDQNSSALKVVSIAVPTAPTVVGSVHIGTNGSQCVVVGNLVYAAADKKLNLVDVSDPTAPVVLTTTIDLFTRASASSVAVINNVAIVGGGDYFGGQTSLTSVSFAAAIPANLNVDSLTLHDVTGTKNVPIAVTGTDTIEIDGILSLNNKKLTNAVVGSGAATSGFVLTADGSGGSAFQAASGGGITGTLTAGRVAVASGASALDSGDPNFTFDTTNHVLALGGTNKTTMTLVAGTMGASQYPLQITGRLANDGGSRAGIKCDFTPGGTGSSPFGIDLIMESGFGTSGTCAGMRVSNLSDGTGTSLSAISSGTEGNVGFYGTVDSNSVGNLVGVIGEVNSGTGVNIGVMGKGRSTAGTANVGVAGFSRSGSTNYCAGYFGIGGSPSTFPTATLACDSLGASVPSFVALDSGTATFTIASNGTVTSTKSITAPSFANAAGGYSHTFLQNTANSSAITSTGEAEFSITGNPLAADINRLGAHFKITISGIYSSGASPGTNTIGFRINSTTLIDDDTITLPALQTSSPWSCIIEGTVRAVGATGAVIGSVTTYYGAASVAAVTTVGVVVGPSSSIDLTGSPTFKVTTNLSASGNSITIQDINMSILN